MSSFSYKGCLTITTREPLSKGDSRMGLIAFHIQLTLATFASLSLFIFLQFSSDVANF